MTKRIDADAVAHALRHTYYALVRRATPSKHFEGVQKQGFWVLGGLMHGPKRMSDLAEASEISQASLTGIVDRLEERGLAKRVRSADDRRVVTVEITDLGRTEMAAANKQFAGRVATLLEPLTETERAEFLRLLAKMNDQKGS